MQSLIPIRLWMCIGARKLEIQKPSGDAIYFPDNEKNPKKKERKKQLGSWRKTKLAEQKHNLDQDSVIGCESQAGDIFRQYKARAHGQYAKKKDHLL